VRMRLAVGLAMAAAGAWIFASAIKAEAPTVGDVRDCRTRAEGRSPQKLPTPPGFRIGPLVIWPSVHTAVGPTGQPTWPYAVKAPIVLPARKKLVLAIAPNAIGRAAFQSRRGGYVTAVRFEACRESEPAFAYRGTVGKLTGFPFAIGIKQRAACISMEVWLDGRTTPIRRVVPVGRLRC
jgi:hypothetical protein